ncbi:uncharacterized protein [Dermacentor albipictus]|uniref:uncharacterized protein isoform X2 n=1 Tax=Dermacentor albipictus TaxID=60249 RepID=UPI0038FCF04E
MNRGKANTSSARPPSKVAASHSQRSLGKTSQSSRPNPPGLTQRKVSASSKSSTSSSKSASSRRGTESDTKGTTFAASSKASARRKTMTTTKTSGDPSPAHWAESQRPGPVTVTQHATTNADDAKKPVDSKHTKKAAAKSHHSEGAALPSGEAEHPNYVSSKVLRKSIDVDKTKSQRDATKDDLGKPTSDKTSVSEVDKSGKADKGKTSVESKSPIRRMSLLKTILKRKSLAVLNAAGEALTMHTPSRTRPEKPKSPVHAAAPDKPETTFNARASLAKISAMNEESGHSELDSQQQRCLALGGALSLTLLMIIFFSVVSYILRSRNPIIPVACQTAECVAAKEYVEGLLGDPKLRCANFYNYVCGQFITNRSSVSAGALEIVHNRLLADQHRRPDKMGGHVAARVYSSCLQFVDLRETPAAAMREACRTINSEQLRAATTFAEIVKVLASVSLQRGLHTVLEIGLVNYTNPGNVSLRFSPGRSIQRKFNKDNHGDLERNLKAAFAWAPEVNTTAAVNLVLALDKRVEEAFAAGARHGDEENMTLRSFVHDLIPAVTTEEWVSALTAANPDSFVASPETPCFVTALGGVRDAFRQLVAVGVHKAASYLAANLEAEVALFEDARQNLRSDAAAKHRFCLDATRRCMASAWHPLAARILQTSGQYSVVKDMYGTLRHVFSSGRRRPLFTWLEPKVHAAAIKRLDRTSVTVIGAEEESQGVAADYAGFTPTVTEPKDFVDGYLSTRRQTQKMQIAAPPARRQVVYANMELTGTAFYDSGLRAIVLPPVLLTEPYFYGSVLPLQFNYATVGAVLAVRMAQVIGTEVPTGNGKSGQDNPRAHWSETALSNFQKSVQCLQELRQNLSLPASPTNSRREQESILLAWMQESGDPDVFSRYWQAAQVLFFARFCLLSCGDGGDAQRRDTSASHVALRDRCLLPLHNMRQFAEAFECTASERFVVGHCKL